MLVALGEKGYRKHRIQNQRFKWSTLTLEALEKLDDQDTPTIIWFYDSQFLNKPSNRFYIEHDTNSLPNQRANVVPAKLEKS